MASDGAADSRRPVLPAANTVITISLFINQMSAFFIQKYIFKTKCSLWKVLGKCTTYIACACQEGQEGFKMSANLYQICPFDEAYHRPEDAIFRCFVSLEVTLHFFYVFRSVCVSCWWPGDGGGNNCVTYLSTLLHRPTLRLTYLPTLFLLSLANFARISYATSSCTSANILILILGPVYMSV